MQPRTTPTRWAGCIGEYNADGSLINEMVYLGNMPVLLLRPSGVFNIQTDQLNSPRAILTSAQVQVWSWDSAPFGETLANDDVDGNGVPLNFNLRFPGQVFDAETGLHYNYFRDYDPVTGRYVESDPIGLNGGIDPYTYVYSNPSNLSDPLGLAGRGQGSQLGNPWNNWQRNHPGRTPAENSALYRQSQLDGYAQIDKTIENIMDAIAPPSFYPETSLSEGMCMITVNYSYKWMCVNPRYRADDENSCYANNGEERFSKYVTTRPISPLERCIARGSFPVGYGWQCPLKEPYLVTPPIGPLVGPDAQE